MNNKLYDGGTAGDKVLQLYAEAILTQSTCGEACWLAYEDICRCSCGGKNHGVLRDGKGERPIRTCKIDGKFYELGGIGKGVFHDAEVINKAAGDRRPPDVVTPTLTYHYSWRETDKGAPARVKTPSASQRQWPELVPFKDEYVHILWIRQDVAEQRRKEASHEQSVRAAPVSRARAFVRTAQSSRAAAVHPARGRSRPAAR